MNRYFFLIFTISYAFAANYTATMSDLQNSFANVNSGAFLVGDNVVVSTPGHNLVQITSQSCTASFVSGGLQCCDVSTNNNCACTNSQFTITFSTNGTYYFKCDVTGHCSNFGYLGQITFKNLPTPTSSSHHNSTNTTSSHHNTTSSQHTTSSVHNTTSSHHNSTNTTSCGAATYNVAITDLSNNFANINGGIFCIHDKIVVSTPGHNIAQIGNKSCNSGYLSGGLECCDVVTNNNCACTNNQFTLTFSNNGTYFFKCFVTGHCSSLNLLGQITIGAIAPTSSHPNNGTSSHASGAERLTSGFGLFFVASFILFVKFFKMI